MSCCGTYYGQRAGGVLKQTSKILIVLVAAAAIAVFWTQDLGRYLSLEALKTHQGALHAYILLHPWDAKAAFLAVYVLSTALSLPGAAVLTLAGGALFGLLWGTILVSFASTIGATLAFLSSRFLLSHAIRARYGGRLKRMDEGFRKEGAFYLFSLRLVPVFPFFLINLLMGLTPIKTSTFFLVSQLGMLPGTVLYVNAGTQLGRVSSAAGILSPGLLFSLAILGLLPLASKRLVEHMRSRSLLKKYPKPSRFDYNLVVIGAGAAGLSSAYIAALLKAKVALVERHKMGGDCLNTGCVPSKTLIRSAKILSYLRRAKDFGLKDVSADFDFAEVMERVQRVIKKIEPHDSVERYAALGVDCIRGDARLVSPYQVQVSGRTLSTKNIILATGAGPLIPPIPGLEQLPYLTSDTVWELRRLPKKLLILGGGPIGCELAQAFARLGSEVHLVEMFPRLLIREDPDVSAFIQERFAREGIQLHLGTKAKAFLRESEKKILLGEEAGREVRIEFDELLLALGRRPNMRGLGLEDLGIELSRAGTIVHDEFLRTKHPNIYTCGDVAGPYQFTHTASHQAWYATINALFRPFKQFRVDYRVVPWCTFTDPEVARVGLNEEDAKSQGVPYAVTTYALSEVDRALADGETEGFVKVLTASGKDRILGATIVGAHAGDLMAEYVLAMRHGLGLNKILSTIHIYPTLAEVNRLAAGEWRRAHAPKRLLKWLGRLHAWRRGAFKEGAR